jgi:hypothetical protein
MTAHPMVVFPSLKYVVHGELIRINLMVVA